MARTFDFFERRLSWHHTVGNGKSFWQAIGDLFDGILASSKDAVRQRLLTKSTDEALPCIGQNFNLDYPARFTAAQARSYIGSPWTHWENAGSRPRMVAELEALGYKNPGVVTYRDLVDVIGTDPTTTFGAMSSFFYVVLRPPFPFAWTLPGKWGDGAKWGEAPYLWGIGGAEVWQLDEVKRVIRKWKPAATSCRFIEIWLSVNIFGVPTRVVHIPVHEDWEYATNGAAREFYNYSYSQERV